MGWFDDVVDFVGDAADAVTDVAEGVVGGIAEAVTSIPVVGDVVEVAAPIAGGMLGTVIGGPVGSMIGGQVGKAFAGGQEGVGQLFDFVDNAIDSVGADALLGPLAGPAAELFNGGSFIDAAGSVLSGGLGDIAGSVLGGGMPDIGDLAGKVLGGGGMPDIGDLAGQFLGGGGLGDVAGQVLGGGGLGDLAGQVMGEGGFGDLAGQFLGGGGLGDLAGQVLGGGGLPDIGNLMQSFGGDGVGAALGAAQQALGGLGLGSLGSAAAGIIGDCMPGTSDTGGWLGGLGDGLPGGGLPFGGCGTFPTPSLTPPIGEAGGGWLESIGQQVAQATGGGSGGAGGLWGFMDDIKQNIAETVDQVSAAGQPLVDPLVQAAGDAAEGAGLPNIDDLIGQLPGLDGASGSVQEKLQQLVETGNLGDALGNLSSNELTQLVGALVAPVPTAVDAVTGGGTDPLGAATSGFAEDDLMIDGRGMDDDAKAIVFGGEDPDDVLGAGSDLGLDGGTAGAEAPGAVEMPTPVGTADDLSIDMPGGDLGAPEVPAVQMPAPEPQPEPEPSDFSQAISSADAVEESFDTMFEGLE